MLNDWVFRLLSMLIHLNACGKNDYKIGCGHGMTPFMTALTYDGNSGPACAHKVKNYLYLICLLLVLTFLEWRQSSKVVIRDIQRVGGIDKRSEAINGPVSRNMVQTHCFSPLLNIILCRNRQ